MPSSLNGDTMKCSVPTSAQLPEASSETGTVVCLKPVVCTLCKCFSYRIRLRPPFLYTLRRSAVFYDYRLLYFIVSLSCGTSRPQLTWVLVKILHCASQSRFSRS